MIPPTHTPLARMWSCPFMLTRKGMSGSGPEMMAWTGLPGRPNRWPISGITPINPTASSRMKCSRSMKTRRASSGWARPKGSSGSIQACRPSSITSAIRMTPPAWVRTAYSWHMWTARTMFGLERLPGWTALTVKRAPSSITPRRSATPTAWVDLLWTPLWKTVRAICGWARSIMGWTASIRRPRRSPGFSTTRRTKPPSAMLRSCPFMRTQRDASGSAQPEVD